MLGDLDSAWDIIDNLEEDGRDRPEMREALAAVQLAERAGETASEIQPLRDKLAADPTDLQAHQDLALALYAGGETEEAMLLLLASIKQDNGWQDGATKTQLFEIFNALGHAHPEVIAARRKLSAYLFPDFCSISRFIKGGVISAQFTWLADNDRARYSEGIFVIAAMRGPFEPEFSELPQQIPVFPLRVRYCCRAVYCRNIF